MLLSLPLVILLLQGNQGIRSYWFWGGRPLAYLAFLGYSILSFLPITGWFLAGVRDLIYKVRRGEQAARLYTAGLFISFITQSLVFPLLLALLAGKQMQLYFRAENYPWRDWARGGAVVHLVFAFVGAFVALLFGGISFSGEGFRAALGMAAAYWIFSLLGVIGLYGEKRDFALGGSLLAGLLGVLFFWVQVYPYLETERDWPTELVDQLEVPLPVYVPEGDAFSVARPSLRRAGVPIAADSATADFILRSWPIIDSTGTATYVSPGRVVVTRRMFGLER